MALIDLAMEVMGLVVSEVITEDGETLMLFTETLTCTIVGDGGMEDSIITIMMVIITTVTKTTKAIIPFVVDARSPLLLV